MYQSVLFVHDMHVNGTKGRTTNTEEACSKHARLCYHVYVHKIMHDISSVHINLVHAGECVYGMSILQCIQSTSLITTLGEA